jgi:hypothetical protein
MTFVWRHPSYYKNLRKKLTTTIPPKKGPQSQGLNVDYNTVKDVKLEKTNGRNRQSTSKRS